MTNLMNRLVDDRGRKILYRVENVNIVGLHLDHKEARHYIVEGFVICFDRVPTMREAQVAQGIGWLETRYGTAWLGDGKGSKNWGAIQSGKPPCGPSTFLYTDTHPNSDGTSTTYSICFRKYESDRYGAAGVVGTAMRHNVIDAANAGNLYGVSAAMRANYYYEGFGATQSDRIANHCKALTNAVRAQCLALGEPMPDGKPSLVAQVGKVIGYIIPAGTLRNLQRGIRGDDVKAWQMVLNQTSAGFSPLVLDGVFGSATEWLTRVWQMAHGLKVDGIVGPKTRAAATAALKAA